MVEDKDKTFTANDLAKAIKQLYINGIVKKIEGVILTKIKKVQPPITKFSELLPIVDTIITEVSIQEPLTNQGAHEVKESLLKALVSSLAGVLEMDI